MTIPAGMPACAVIDLDAIRHNVAQLRERAGGRELMAVVKADGYGHGLLPCARAAVRGGASWLGVAQLSEALALRAGGVDVPILSWLTVPGDAYPEAVRAGIDLGISTGWAHCGHLTHLPARFSLARRVRPHLHVAMIGIGPIQN